MYTEDFPNSFAFHFLVNIQVDDKYLCLAFHARVIGSHNEIIQQANLPRSANAWCTAGYI
jgi:hypothetical protein